MYHVIKRQRIQKRFVFNVFFPHATPPEIGTFKVIHLGEKRWLWTQLQPRIEHVQCPPLSAESVDVSQYGAVFNAQLQACTDKQLLPVASDVLELMLCKQLKAEAGLLQTLLNKLGKQKFWQRSREIFIRKSLQAPTTMGCLFFFLLSSCVSFERGSWVLLGGIKIVQVR